MTRLKNSSSTGGRPTALGAKKAAKKQKAEKPTPAEPAAAEGPRRRHRPGVVALREIRTLGDSKRFCIRRGPFMRYVKEVSRKLLGNGEVLKFTDEAKLILQRICENRFVETMRDGNKLAAHRDSPMLTAKDLAASEELKGSVEVSQSIRQSLCDQRPVMLACEQRSAKIRARKERATKPAVSSTEGAEPVASE